MFVFDILQPVKDKVTKFQGVITARAEYSTGCKQYLVTPKMKKGETSYPEGTWIDEDRLVCSAGKTIKIVNRNDGGPQQSPSKV